MSALDYLMGQVAVLKAKVDQAASYRWATVVGVDPLRVRFDGDVEDLAASPVNLAGPLVVGARVFVLTTGKRAYVTHAASGGGGVSGGVPAGTVVSFAGSVVPSGWLACDGAAYRKTDYPALAAALGATGTGSMFSVPDMRGRVLLGAGSNGVNTSPHWGSVQAGENTFPLGESGGEYSHTLGVENLPPHEHNVVGTSSSWANGAGVYKSNVGAGSGWEIVSNWVSGAPWLKTNSVGAGKALKTLPPYVTVHFIIKT